MALVKDYRDGALLSNLRSGGLESAASNSPWARRSNAPTDYSMIQRLTNDNAVSGVQSSPLNGDTKYQLALIVSGLETDPCKNHCDLSDALACQDLTPRRALVLGMALCAGVKLLQLQQSQPGSGMAGSISGASSIDSIGAALFVGIQSLVLPLVNPKLPALNGGIPNLDATPSAAFSRNSTVESLGMPIIAIHAEGSFGTEAFEPDFALGSFPSDGTDNTASSPDSIEEDIGGEAHNEVMPSKSVSSGPGAQTAYEIRDDLGDVLNRLQDSLLDALSVTETRDYMPPPPTHNDGRIIISGLEEYRHILRPTAMKRKEPKRPAVSIPNRMKSYAAKTRGLGGRIKKRALGGLKVVKKDYIALVESDDILL